LALSWLRKLLIELSILCGQIIKGLGVDVPGALKRIIQVREHKMSTAEQLQVVNGIEKSRNRIVHAVKVTNRRSVRGMRFTLSASLSSRCPLARLASSSRRSCALLSDSSVAVASVTLEMIPENSLSVRSLSSPLESIPHSDSVTARA
jgi:hypothetical protein